MSQQTAKKAVDILLKKNVGFQILNGPEKKNLAVAFARENMVLYGNAFDIIKCKKKIDFTNEDAVYKDLDSIIVYEIKSTNRPKMDKNFINYFFDLTTAELLVAQSLNERYKFAFVNTITENFIELTLQGIFSKAAKIYPKWAIRF